MPSLTRAALAGAALAGALASCAAHHGRAPGPEITIRQVLTWGPVPAGGCARGDVPDAGGTLCYRLGVTGMAVRHDDIGQSVDITTHTPAASVSLSLTGADRRPFDALVRRSVGGQLAVVVGGRVVVAPVIAGTSFTAGIEGVPIPFATPADAARFVRETPSRP